MPIGEEISNVYYIIPSPKDRQPCLEVRGWKILSNGEPFVKSKVFHKRGILEISWQILCKNLSITKIGGEVSKREKVYIKIFGRAIVVGILLGVVCSHYYNSKECTKVGGAYMIQRGCLY